MLRVSTPQPVGAASREYSPVPPDPGPFVAAPQVERSPGADAHGFSKQHPAKAASPKSSAKASDAAIVPSRKEGGAAGAASHKPNVALAEVPRPLRRECEACAAYAESPFQKVFVQREGPGYASYHFISPEEAYISFATAPRDWTLDDGTRYPKRKDFTELAYDAQTRTLLATIDWWPKTKRGEQRWEYKMVFTMPFARISEGHIHMFPPNASQPSTIRQFGKHVEYRRLKESPDGRGPLVDPMATMDLLSPQSKEIMEVFADTLDRAGASSKDLDGKQVMKLAFGSPLAVGNAMQTLARDKEANVTSRGV